jgi:hypothetical protein
MKVRNIVRGGAVVALSLGLASLGTGMGLTASHSSEITQSSSTRANTAGPSNPNGLVNPKLICDPGGTCGTPQYFEVQKTVGGETGYARVEYVGSTVGVVGCTVGVAATGFAYSLAPEATVSFLSGSVVWQFACYGGAKLANDVVGFFEHIFVIPPQVHASISSLAES